ncbi:MAG: biotin synthase BioB [Planctomycetaceae bacterium]|jgi:biotin synthase|nr:biotin synthase BioB [Planctomycetaceae bacterium]MBT4725053.1 biotin synthase BioB [Planctomycetaceae bacterium]MBT4845174.1 biotin synthase BioB [Planctomycetaceae bacterium]MBT5126479.1 biotin synthase BioB [Planctomycetaceae bacterium]MBT5599550.1 biotin synthase BioB [Planctomycetaceae bacterium]
MASTTHETHFTPTTTSSDWHALAQQVLSGTPLDQQQAMQILTSPDDEILDLMSAAFRIRKQYFGKTVQLYFLMNAKSGLCPEDCSYCSQSKDSAAEIPKYNILSQDKLLDGAKIAAERNAKTYCIVISARAPSERELAAVETIVPHIKEQYDLKICACLGLLSDDQAQRLSDAGVDRVNHNLNTSEANYKNICTTHSYQDRMDTLHAVRRAGMEICSGGIIGMGEQNQDVIDMAFALRDLEADSIPLNFLNAIEGTQLQTINTLTPQYCLKALAMYRFANPTTELRIAGGRELHLSSLQPLGLYAANSIFVGDYLTTAGQAPDADYQMIKDLGFEVTRNIE